MRLEKPYTNKQYADLAVFCNENGLIIEDKGDYLESVNPPEPTTEDKQAQVRGVRNSYLETYVDPFQLVIRWGTLSEQEQTDLVNYRQYLLDYTNQENWWESLPLTFEEWKTPPVDEPVIEENENDSEVPDDNTSVSVDNTYL